MLKHYDLFSVRLTQCKFPLQAEELKQLQDVAEKEFKPDRIYSSVGGTQLHEDFEGKKDLDKRLNTFLINNFGLQIVNGWLNILDGKAFNSPHMHGGNSTTHSAVLYISNNNTDIVFIKDIEYFSFSPKIFDLIIFPSSLIHFVPASGLDEKRISYALNLTPIHNNENNR